MCVSQKGEQFSIYRSGRACSIYRKGRSIKTPYEPRLDVGGYTTISTTIANVLPRTHRIVRGRRGSH